MYPPMATARPPRMPDATRDQFNLPRSTANNQVVLRPPGLPNLDGPNQTDTENPQPAACNDAHPTQPMPSHYIYTRARHNLTARNKNQLAFTFFVDA